MNTSNTEQRHSEETAQLAYLREIVLKTVPSGRTPDPFTNATCLIRMGRLMNALDADIAVDIERFFDKDTIKFAFAAADMLDAALTGEFCKACQCYTTQPSRKMSCYRHINR